MSVPKTTAPGAQPLGDVPKLDPQRVASLEERLFKPSQGRRIKHYELQERIGAGAQGLVRRAFDTKLKRSVAIKEVLVGSARALRRLEREAQSLAKLSHPNVVQVHDSGMVAPHSYFIVMEFVRGESLDAWRQRDDHPLADTIAIFAQVCDGLAAMHREGLVHRDVKPANIIVGEDGVPKLVDFGMASGLDADPEHPSFGATHAPDESQSASGAQGDASIATAPAQPKSSTVSARARSGASPSPSPSATWSEADPSAELVRTHGFVGTPKFAAPEQFMGLPNDPRSDQFSLCVALFEAVTGVHPFPGRTYAELARQVAGGDIHWPKRRLPRRLRHLLERGLSIRARDRFESMDAVAQALRALSKKHPALRAMPWLVSAGVAAGAIMAAGAPADVDCDAEAVVMVERWTEQRATLASAAEASAGARTASLALGALDHWARAWASARQGACEARAVGVASAPATIACLERGRASFDVLVSTLERELEVAVEPSATPILHFGVWLEEPSACSADPTTWAESTSEVGAISARLTRARVLRLLGRWTEALALTEQVAQETTALELYELKTIADVERGSLLLLMGEIDTGVDVLEQALLDADVRGQVLVAAEVRGQLGIEAAKRGERAGPIMVRAGLAQARAAGADGTEVEAWLLTALAQAEGFAGNWPAAVEAGEQALQAFRDQAGEHNARTATVRINLGSALSMVDDENAARPHLDGGWAVLNETLGPSHPLTARHAIGYGKSLIRAERWREATDVLAQSIAATEGVEQLSGLWCEAQLERAYGLASFGEVAEAQAHLAATHPSTGVCEGHEDRWNEVGIHVYSAAKEWDRAIEAAARALKAFETAQTRQPAMHARGALRLALLLHYAGRTCKGAAVYERHRQLIDEHGADMATQLPPEVRSFSEPCKEALK